MTSLTRTAFWAIAPAASSAAIYKAVIWGVRWGRRFAWWVCILLAAFVLLPMAMLSWTAVAMAARANIAGDSRWQVTASESRPQAVG